MTDTPWTPGPWEWNGDALIAPGVAVVLHYDMYDGDQQMPTEPNARLIAAAPDLAELLAEFVLWIENEYGEAWGSAEDARALLSRIHGEQVAPQGG